MANNNKTMRKQDGPEIPPLVSDSDETDGEPPPLLDEESDDESDKPPPLIDSDEQDEDEEDEEDDGPPPLLSDEGSNGVLSKEGSEGPPDLISDDSADDDEEDDEGKWQARGFRTGFLNKQGAPRPAQPYGQRGVGRREQVLRPTTASAPGQKIPAGTTASTKKARPKAETRQPDQAPQMASLSHLAKIQEERQKEREALRGMMDFLPKERAHMDVCLGRCCLRPGSLGWGGKWNCDKQAFKVKEADRRLQMSCSNGCALLFHYPSCWRNFKEGYRAMLGEEVEDVVLRGKKKMIPFPCHTDGCGGYIRQAILLEGPRGESFKQKQYDIPPELEEQLQAAKQKKREEQVARSSKRKPTEQEAQDAAVLAGKEAAKKQFNKKKMRKEEAAGAQGDKQEEQQAGAAAGQAHVEGWTEVGGLSRGLRKEAAREARDRTKDAAAREAAAAGLKAAMDAQAQAPAAGAAASSASGGIKIARRAQPELQQQQQQQQAMQMEFGAEAVPCLPEFLIPDDAMLKPLHKVAEEEEAEAERRRVLAASSRAHKEQQEQQEQVHQQERAGAEAQKAIAKQAANAEAQQALQRKKKKAMKVDLGSLLQETGGTERETVSPEASNSTMQKGKKFVPHQGAAVQQQTTFSMSNFPTLEDAIMAPRHGKEKEEVILMDDMLEALRQLKISINEIHFTQHLLIECLDIRSILEVGQSVEDVVNSLCADAGSEVIQMEVFERQDAVAITTANVEQAQHCMVQLQLQQVYRRKIQLCFLEDFPSHALLNQLMTDMHATDQASSDLTTANFPSLHGSEAASTSRPTPSFPSHPSHTRAFPLCPQTGRPLATEPPPPPPPRESLATSASESAAKADSSHPSLNPTARAFAPLSSSAAGASLGRLTPSCSSASSQVGASDAGASTTASAAARSGTAAHHLQQQRQQQQQQQQLPGSSASAEQQGASASVPAGRTGPVTAAGVAGDEEDVALQLALEMSKQDTRMREEELEEAERAALAAISSAPAPESPAAADDQSIMEPPVTAPAGAAEVASAFGSPPPAGPPVAVPSPPSTQPTDDIIRRYDALHFSITNTHVLGHYRAYTQFQLPGGFFRDPHLVNGQERCGLALFNIDSQTLEGLWETTEYDTATQNVIFKKVEDSPPLPIHQAKALLDQGGLPLMLNPSPNASRDTQYSLPPQSKLSGPLASAVVRMMLLGTQAPAPPSSTSRTPEVPAPPPTVASPPPQLRRDSPAPPPPPHPSLSLLHAASPPPRTAAASPAPPQQPPHAPAPAAPATAQPVPPPSQQPPTVSMPHMSPDAQLQSSLSSALATKGGAPAQTAAAAAVSPPSSASPPPLPTYVAAGLNPPPTQPQGPRPPGPAIPFLPPALAHLMSARMGLGGTRPPQQPHVQQPLQQESQQQKPISTTAVRPSPAALSPPPFSSPSPPAPAAAVAAVSSPSPPPMPAAAPSPTLPAAPADMAVPPPSSSSPAPVAASPVPPTIQPAPNEPPGATSAATLAMPPQPPTGPTNPTTVAGAVPPTAARASPPLQAAALAGGVAPKPGTVPAAPGGTKPTSIQARLMCVMCGTRRATWFNMVCKHMGPCEVCLPQGESAYKQCFKCGGGTKLHRVF